MKLNIKALLLIGVLFSPLVLSGCGSEVSKVEKACGLAAQGSTGLTDKDPAYTDYYSEAADILKDLAAGDPKYAQPYRAALLWSSGDNLAYSDLKILMTLSELCEPYKEEVEE